MTKIGFSFAVMQQKEGGWPMNADLASWETEMADELRKKAIKHSKTQKDERKFL